MTTHVSQSWQAVALPRGAGAAVLVAGLLSLLPASAAARTEFQGWDARHEFHMIIDVEMVAATHAVKIDGGRIEFRGATGLMFPIEQAQGAKAPKPAANQMAGVVVFVQTGGTRTFTLFTGNLVGTLANGTLTARGVRFEAFNQVHNDDFVMVNGNGGATASSPAPGQVKPVGLTAAQLQAIRNYNANRGTAGQPANQPKPGTAGGATHVMLDNSNTGGVSQMANTKRPSFFSRVPITITEIWTYHWNNGRGEAPGSISVLCSNGVTYGPWHASGSSGQGGAPNVNWTVHPDAQLPAGSYTIVDSSPGTWSENVASHECGFTRVSGR